MNTHKTINVDTGEPPVTTLADLKRGDMFVHNGDLFIVTTQIRSQTRAIRIGDGSPEVFDNDTNAFKLVRRVTITVET